MQAGILTMSAREVHTSAAFCSSRCRYLIGSPRPWRDSMARLHTSIQVCAHRSILDLMLLAATCVFTTFPHRNFVSAHKYNYLLICPPSSILLICSFLFSTRRPWSIKIPLPPHAATRLPMCCRRRSYK
ncbi:hypothetical protein ACQKWADRAFT_122856 [Trichoderma austrokoningii]